MAIYCSDGRYNEQFDEFLHDNLGLPRYDRLVIPGGAACLAGHMIAHREEHALLEALAFLIDAHSIERVVLIAHHNCGYYLKRLMLAQSTLRQAQEQDLQRAAAAIQRIAPRVKTETYFASLSEDAVQIEPIS
jgi:carbonic anhydrase